TLAWRTDLASVSTPSLSTGLKLPCSALTHPTVTSSGPCQWSPWTQPLGRRSNSRNSTQDFCALLASEKLFPAPFQEAFIINILKHSLCLD
ncbi:hypothetical protein ATANTOWER_025626, partial [Ataeniobius toweri]|nr:hypothetical protein [Ataeniobius toweri]